MCTVLYLATDATLAELPWDPASPAFHLRAADDVETAALRRTITKRHFYYIGTAEKCGCPFSYGTSSDIDDSPEELASREAAIEGLQRVVRASIARAGAADLLAFESEHLVRPLAQRMLTPEALGSDTFALYPPEHIHIQ
jgi:hypothetical protein